MSIQGAELCSIGPKLEQIIQPKDMAEWPSGRAWQAGRVEQCWEAQWQDFLGGLDSPQAGWGKDPGPWEDTRAFLASFEQVPQACQWPREEWVAWLLPALSGEAQWAFGTLEARDREDYGKVKMAILCREANRTETLQQHFRQFCSREVEDPLRIYSQLQELCCRWLRPERHLKKQILELLILEQFLAILPPELQSWIIAGSPENCTKAAALAEDFLLSHQGEAEKQKGQEEKIMEENPTDLEATGETVGILQPEEMAERPGWRAWREGREEQGQRLLQHWEAQWQEFLRGLDPPQARQGKEPSPWEDTKAFLVSFEQVAQACQWPREEWVARLLPALSGEAQRAFGDLEARDREDYGKVKAAILRGEANRMETLRRHFRQFRSREVEDPRRIYSQLQELCCRWLRPERHSKEQILELLILEQFLAILPPELQSWIRAGGPENCTQAAALAEDFLLSQQGGEAENWQGPLQEVCPDAEARAMQRQIVRETEQSDEGEVGLLGRESKGSDVSCSSHPPEGQEADRTGLTAMDFKETDMSQPTVEQTPIQPGRRTIFWQVLQEDNGNVNSLGDRRGRPFRVENSLCGGNKAEGKTRMEPEKISGNMVMRSEIHEETCDGRQSWIKEENDIPAETGPEETDGTSGGNSQWSFSGTPEVCTQRCELKGLWQEMKPMEGENKGREPSGDLTGITGEIYTEDTEEKRPQFSKYGRKYRYKPGFLTEHVREDIGKCPIIREDTQQQCSPKPHPRICAGEKCYKPSKGRKVDNVTSRQSNHQGEKTYECPECGKSFSCQKSLKSHQVIHTAGMPFECSLCGKSYRHRETLLKHQKIHASEKLHECLMCGKIFIAKVALMRHQRIHAGEKPFQCPQCEKSFRYQQTLKEHQALHNGEKPHDCPVCGENFHLRDMLWRHQRAHAGERPHECPQCKKRFKRKVHLMRHQRIHTGEKPFQCSQCGKAFRQKEHLRRHQRTHTGEKPFNCPECGKSYSRRNKLISHQGTHRGQRLYQVS